MERPHGRPPLAPLASTVFLLLLGMSYASSADVVYAITIWPAWIWLGVGWTTAGFAWRSSKVGGKCLLAGWLLFVVLFADEPWSIARSLWVGEVHASEAVKVVSLNCAGGDPLAMIEALARSPELVLLQESPPQKELLAVLNDGWATVLGPDAAILALGRLEPMTLPEWTDNFVAARWWRQGAKSPVYVVSLRLEPPVLRFDYWNPACWRAYAEGKRRRRTELTEVLAYVETLPKDAAIILGGDFNTPPDRRIQAGLMERFIDVFRASGAGWGATGINDYPLVRIDQIWVAGGSPVIARAIKTKYSDHRRVEAQVTLSP